MSAAIEPTSFRGRPPAPDGPTASAALWGLAARLIVLAAATLVVAWLMATLIRIVLLVVVALILAAGLSPLARRLQRARLPLSAAVLLIYLGLVLLLGLQQTVTAGIVSAARLPGEDAGRGPLDLLGGAIQTDAAINPGNLGGPLFNAVGEVIGVNTPIVSQSGGNIGIGFAIPINVVKRVAPELIQSGCYGHPLIGVSTIPLTAFGPQARQALGVAANQRGLLVQEVSAGAAAAGVRAGERVVTLSGEQVRTGGDIIVAIDGHPVTSGGTCGPPSRITFGALGRALRHASHDRLAFARDDLVELEVRQLRAHFRKDDIVQACPSAALLPHTCEKRKWIDNPPTCDGIRHQPLLIQRQVLAGRRIADQNPFIEVGGALIERNLGVHTRLTD